MSEDQTKITSEAALIMEKMVGLEPDDPRYIVLKATIDYKASWLELGEHLNVVAENKDYKQWGYKNFKTYCAEELQLNQAVARKLVRGFQWIDAQAPQFLPRYVDEEVSIEPQAAALSSVPDVEAISVLVTAQRELDKDRLSTQDYDSLKERALSGEANARELRKELKEQLPAPTVDPAKEQIKVLRRTLTATERIIGQLTEHVSDDPELLELAEKLRERVFAIVSAKLDAQAYSDGGDAAEALDASGAEQTSVLPTE